MADDLAAGLTADDLTADDLRTAAEALEGLRVGDDEDDAVEIAHCARLPRRR